MSARCHSNNLCWCLGTEQHMHPVQTPPPPSLPSPCPSWHDHAAFCCQPHRLSRLHLRPRSIWWTTTCTTSHRCVCSQCSHTRLLPRTQAKASPDATCPNKLQGMPSAHTASMRFISIQHFISSYSICGWCVMHSKHKQWQHGPCFECG
jgi:hypothetical protein